MKAERAGELYIGAGAVLWGLFPVITILSFSSLPAISSLAWTLAFATAFFAVIITIRGKWREVASARALPDILLTAFFIGIVFYLLQFFGLTVTSAGNASILALAEIFFTYLLFNAWRGEYFPREHLWGALLMVLGAGIVLYPDITSFNAGDFLIIAAAAVAPVGNFFQRRARERVSSEVIMFVRSAVSGAFVFFLAAFLGAHPFSPPGWREVLYLAVNGVALFGISKIFWIEGIHRISVTKANALSSVSPLCTLAFAYALLGAVPTFWQIAAFVPMFFGVLLISEKRPPPSAEPLLQA